MHVGWSNCEFGAPEIDPKRPYGNSWVIGDIHEILTGEDLEELTESQEEEYRQLHEQTQTALQIILSTGKFEEGLYMLTEPYSSTWVRKAMINSMVYKDYTASMVFDTEDMIIVGRVLDIDDIILFHGETIAEFESNFHAAIEDYLAASQELGSSPEKPAS